MGLLDWGFPILAGIFWLIIPLVVIWSMAWKGIALWKAGQNGHLGWFIALFLLNTLGILPIIYIFAFSQKRG
jgi:methionyl-tRNA synthetase